MRVGRIERAWSADALRPAVGWKVWRVDHDPNRTRLRSVLYGDVWPLRRPLQANCRRLLHTAHEAPHAGCECGIHAGRELAAWEHYLAVDRANRVFGRVLLWGSTVEGTAGWRAAEARPVEIFVPADVEDGAAVAAGLSRYGVPVHRAGETLELPALEEVLAG
jgi:hypothetical protein